MLKSSATVSAAVCALLLSACSSTDSTGPLAPVSSVTISAEKTDLIVGQQLQLAATPLNATGALLPGRTAVWASSNQAVATVSGAGVVTAVAPGAATISAVAGEATGSLNIRVFAVPIATITIAPVAAPLSAATHISLIATTKDAAGATLTGRSLVWTSSDSSIARVSQDGVVTGLAPGSAAITAASDGKSATVTVNVVAGAPASLVIGNAGKVFVQGSRQLTVVVRDVLGNVIPNPSVFWTSSDGSAVSVSGAGVISGLKAGTDVTIRATSTMATDAITTRAFAVVAMSGGDDMNCALSDTAEILCWGLNTSGQIGTGPIGADTSFVPRLIAGGLRFSSLSVGASHACALTLDGTAYCWGAGESGQIGDGSRTLRMIPTKVLTSVRFSQIAAGRYHTCGIAMDGDLYCWGGSGSPTIPAIPTKIESPARLVSISSGEGQTCGLDAAGILYCWTRFSTPSAVVPVPGDQRFVMLSITRNQRCALTSEGKVFCWSSGSPVERVTALRFKTISTSSERLCGLTFDNAAYCVGTGSAGQLGDGAIHNTPTPDFVRVSPGISNVTQFAILAPGLYSTCGASAAGVPFCWGLGSRIGIGFSATQFSPVMVAQPQ